VKSLICINTYKSAELIKAFVWDYINFVCNHPEYDFIVSLDGADRETIEYCNRHKIPLLYSEENEGVGISKNRVIESFGNYDYYFFIEDDIELLNPKVFETHIKLSNTLDIHHFSLFESRRIHKQKNILQYENYHIIQAMYGGAPFNFFTKKGLEVVGGFHTMFAKYKRFGHTEHTYRFVHNKLSTYPFQLIQECLDDFRWNDPISRVKLSVDISDNHLFIEEENLIKEELKFFPVQTLAPYKITDKKSASSCERIILDKDVGKHKQRFYFKLSFLEMARKVKNKLKTVLGK